MHSPGSTGSGDARAVSDGAERGTRRGTREGWRLLAVVGAAAVLWSGQRSGGSAGSGWGGGVLALQPAFSFVSCPLRPRPARLFPAMTSPESRGGPLLVGGAAGGNLGAGLGRSQSRGAARGGVARASSSVGAGPKQGRGQECLEEIWGPRRDQGERHGENTWE